MSRSAFSFVDRRVHIHIHPTGGKFDFVCSYVPLRPVDTHALRLPVGTSVGDHFAPLPRLRRRR